MNQTQLETACQALMAEEADRRLSGEHPSPEQLAAFKERRLEGDAYDRVRQHLLDCIDCMAIWRGLRHLEQEPPATTQVSEFERALFHRSLKARHAAEDTEHAPSARGAAPRDSAAHPRFFFPTALAAALFAAVLGLSLWNLEQRKALEALAAPQSNVASHYLEPASSKRSAGTHATPQILNAADNSILQITPPLLADSATPAPTTYTLQILDHTDRPVWQLPGNRLNDLGSLTLYLPPGTLDPGDYRLELSADEASEVLEDYLLEVH